MTVKRYRRGAWYTCGALVMVLVTMPLYAAGVSGTVEWAHRSPLGFPVSGVIQEVLVRVGDAVTKGQALVRLDPRTFDAGLEMARAKQDGLAPAFTEAKRELERAQDLYERTVLADHELELVRIAFQGAEAAFRAAKAAVQLAELEWEYSVLRAPFAGTVVRRDVEVGESVVTRLKSRPVIVVAGGGPPVIRARVPTVDLDRLTIGQSVAVTYRGASLAATVSQISPEPVDHEGDIPRYMVVVAPASSAPALRVGARVELELP